MPHSYPYYATGKNSGVYVQVISYDRAIVLELGPRHWHPDYDNSFRKQTPIGISETSFIQCPERAVPTTQTIKELLNATA